MQPVVVVVVVVIVSSAHDVGETHLHFAVQNRLKADVVMSKPSYNTVVASLSALDVVEK